MSPIRQREQAIAVSCAAEPGISPMRGKDQRTDGGGMSTGRDVEIVPLNDVNERMADRISFVLGEASPFDVEYGYHAQGVSLKTPIYAPHGWQARTIDMSVGKIVAHCMEPNDLVTTFFVR